MSEPMAELSPERLNTASSSTHAENDMDTTRWHDPPSSPFISHIESEDRENIAPTTPSKPIVSLEDDFPQSAFKRSPEKKKLSPSGLEDEFSGSPANRSSPKKASPLMQMSTERPESAMSSRSRRSSPTKAARDASVESMHEAHAVHPEDQFDIAPTPVKRPSSSHKENILRDNEGLTVAMRIMEHNGSESSERTSTHQPMYNIGDATFDDTDLNPDGPELTSIDVDDTSFSMFSEMPGMDMTKFAALRQSPLKNGLVDQVST